MNAKIVIIEKKISLFVSTRAFSMDLPCHLTDTTLWCHDLHPYYDYHQESHEFEEFILTRGDAAHGRKYIASQKKLHFARISGCFTLHSIYEILSSLKLYLKQSLYIIITNCYHKIIKIIMDKNYINDYAIALQITLNTIELIFKKICIRNINVFHNIFQYIDTVFYIIKKNKIFNIKLFTYRVSYKMRNYNN